MQTQIEIYTKCKYNMIQTIFKSFTHFDEYCKQLSSVNNLQNLLTAFTLIRNSSGPSTEPWSTTAWIGAVEENICLHITRCVRFVSRFLAKYTSFHQYHTFLIYIKVFFAKQIRKYHATWFLSTILQTISSYVSNNWKTIEWPCKNPAWYLKNNVSVNKVI